MGNKRLTKKEITAGLKSLDGWELDDQSIVRSLEFEDFGEAIDFIVRIADHAEDSDHHPEIFNVYNSVKLRLTTHDADGLTQKDLDLAKLIDDEVEV